MPEILLNKLKNTEMESDNNTNRNGTRDNDKLDLDRIKMKDLSEYLSLTNYLKDYTREEIETFYLKKRKVLDNEQHVKDCEKANKWNNDFENLLRYFYDLGFGPGTVVKRNH